MDSDIVYSISTSEELQNVNLTDSLPLIFDSRQGYRKVLLGYFLPPIIIFTTILNTFIVYILTRPNMRSSVNIILTALAISDTLTGLTALPYYFYFYSMKQEQTFVPYSWCYIQKLCSGILPTIFHTISVWLTFTLAIQRYIYLCHSLKAKRLCTVRRMSKVVVTVAIFSFIFHSPRLFDSSFIKVSLYSAENNIKVQTCVEVFQEWSEYTKNIFYPVYYWLRLTTIHLFPTIGLIILNTILIVVIRSTQQRRRRLILQNRHSEWRRVKDTNCSTILLVVVITTFIIVEVPMGVFMLLTVLQNQYDVKIMTLSENLQELVSTVFNFIVLMSYPLNFCIYVSMSKQFRSHFIKTIFSNKLRSNNSAEKTLQTIYCKSGEKSSSSAELAKSVFTVTSSLHDPHGRRHSMSVTFSSNSSLGTSSILTNRQRAVSECREDLERIQQAGCTCGCPLCLSECQHTV